MIKTVNIHDFKDDENIPDDVWVEIFKKQMLLIKEYEKIEKMEGILERVSTNIDTAYGQKIIKDFAWRITEELTEAIEARNVSEDKSDEAYLHFQEELIDALHFLTELTIIAGYDETIIPYTITITPETDWHSVVYYLGLMCNCLKNKPWKQSQMLTDRAKFKEYLMGTWITMFIVLHNADLDLNGIYQMYFKKNKVNQFRQRSKY